MIETKGSKQNLNRGARKKMQDEDRSFFKGSADQANIAFKIGCETELNWIKRRLNFERKGKPVECLRKGYGHGSSLVFKPTTSDEPTAEETKMLDLWKGMASVVRVFSIGSVDAPPFATNPLSGSFRDHLETSKFMSHQDPTVVYDILAGDDCSIDALTCLEDLQHGESALGAMSRTLFLGPRRATSRARKIRHTVNQPRNYAFLEESFSLAQTNSVFDEEDMANLCATAFRNGRVLLVMPQLTEHVAVVDGRFVGCEIDFLSKTIIFYSQSDTADLQWHLRSIVQQFVLFDEKWQIRKFCVQETTASLLFVMILRLFDFPVDTDRDVLKEPAHVERILMFFSKRKTS